MDCSMPGIPVLHYLPELLTFMSIESAMLTNHLILCHPLLLLTSIWSPCEMTAVLNSLMWSFQNLFIWKLQVVQLNCNAHLPITPQRAKKCKKQSRRVYMSSYSQALIFKTKTKQKNNKSRYFSPLLKFFWRFLDHYVVIWISEDFNEVPVPGCIRWVIKSSHEVHSSCISLNPICLLTQEFHHGFPTHALFFLLNQGAAFTPGTIYKLFWEMPV